MLSSAALYKKDKRRIDPAKLESMIGEEVGISDWAILDQQKIDAFAELTLDPYFIHTDPAEISLHIGMVNRLLKSINQADSVGTLRPVIEWKDDITADPTIKLICAKLQ